MNRESPEISAARNLASQIASLLDRAPSFQELDPGVQSAIVRDLGTIRQALDVTPAASAARDPYAFALDTPRDLMRRRFQDASRKEQTNTDQPAPAAEVKTPAGPKQAATDTIARRAGALSDEIDFPAFVAGLIHNTFDAIVDSTIRQMEAFADLVSAVAKDVKQFTDQNVTPNQARDWLAQQHPADLQLDLPTGEGGSPSVRARTSDENGDAPSPAWLADYGLEGQPLTDELIEEELLPAARERVGESRLQMLATMVLLGMNRIVVRDGSISARLRFRAVAKDKAAVDYAVANDPGGGASWGTRGNEAYVNHSTMISTVGVNVQAESDLKAELFGEVKINFVSETLPLERFADQARMVLLQRNARYAPQPKPEPPPAQPNPPSAPLPPPAVATVPPNPPPAVAPPVNGAGGR